MAVVGVGVVVARVGVAEDVTVADGDRCAAGREPSLRAPGQHQQRGERRQRTPQSSRLSLAHRVSSWREDSWSLRSTLDTCVSTVLIEMNSSDATSL